MTTFPERLKELRKSKGVTQKIVADFLGIRDQAYQRYELGMREPILDVIIKLADYFGVSMDYITGRKNALQVFTRGMPGVEPPVLGDCFIPTFPERIKALRKSKGVTQKAVAEYLSMVPRAYQDYEYGKREPNHETTIKLADYFGVSLDYLLGRVNIL